MLSRIIVCGGRDADIDYDIVDNCISEIISDCDDDIEFVSGGARGGDQLGEAFASAHDYHIIQFNPDWKTYGRAAGPIRNHQMVDYIDECDNPIVIAFWDGVSKGTRDTIKYAQSKHIPVHIIRYKQNKESIQSGVQLDSGKIIYDFDNDEPEDVLPLVNQQTVQSKKHGHVFYYSFKANKGHPDWSKFLDTLKHSEDSTELRKLADQVCNRLFAKFNYFDCILYPKSASKLNDLIIGAIHNIDPYMPAYAVSKSDPKDIEFDWDAFNAKFNGDKEKYEKLCKRIDYMMDRIHRSDRFSMQKQVYPMFRRYVSGFLSIEDLDNALDDIIASETILILDDIVTSGRTTFEMINMLESIGYEGDIVVYSLIYNK